MQPKFFSWRLKVILALGCLGGLALALFSQHVASMSETSFGPAPLSWKFKPNSARVAAAFQTGVVMQETKPLADPMLPVIDQALPDETELALFALG